MLPLLLALLGLVRAEEVPYDERLAYVQELAETHPVRGGSRGPESLGGWAGIYEFTRWQRDSGRDRLPLWEVVNREFTIRAREIARGADCARHDSPAVCGAWRALFAEATAKPRSARTAGLLWTAHTAALADALVRHRDLLEAAPVEEDEKRFWRGRTCLVFTLYQLRYPTSEAFVHPVVRRLEPPCSPLGAPHCRVDDLVPAARRMYVRRMIALGEDREALDRCIAAKRPRLAEDGRLAQ